MVKVYLSGGMASGWQDEIKQKLQKDVLFFDPRTHNFHSPKSYTAWDLLAVDQCDIVFAYMEDINPSGIGLALEVGYAKAKGKFVILVDEKASPYFPIVAECANVVCYNLKLGLTVLVKVLGLFQERKND